ncbi:MAG: electron transfer flavoprotein subunit beta [Ignavibacteriae bacterium]|nr:electron transfer flavoprotein subunit beta [Ignavibacteriota bacterium]
MDILVFLKQVPDLVEELEIDAGGTTLDSTWLRYIPSEYDEHALEQALLLKERHGGTVHVVTIDIGEADDMLYSALAKGADSAGKITADFSDGASSTRLATALQDTVCTHPYDVILTGVQSIDDVEGPTGAFLARGLGIPYVGSVNGVSVNGDAGRALVRKEYPGGAFSEIEVHLPALIGIQAAEQPPRYVPISRIRQTKAQAHISEYAAPETAHPTWGRVLSMRKVESTGSAVMLDGDPGAVAQQLVDILQEHNVLR